DKSLAIEQTELYGLIERLCSSFLRGKFMQGAPQTPPCSAMPSRRKLLAAAAAGVATAAAAAPAIAQAIASVAGEGTAAQFLPYVNFAFLVSGPNTSTSLKLVRVEQWPRGRRPTQLRDPFSLVFRDPFGTALKPQIYQVQDPSGNVVPMFLSPVLKDPGFYEA